MDKISSFFKERAMSNGEKNVFERLFKMLAKICMMIVDGVRDAEEVAEILQAILAGKRLVEATPTLQDMIASWKTFYKEVFGLDLDFSGIKIPERKPGFDRLIIVAQGMTPQRLFDKCKESFPSWKYTDRSLDEAITSDRTSKNGHYAIWVRDRVEADEENKGLSVNQLKKRGTTENTLEERMLYELKFFKEIGDHLDKSNWTLCSGSRHADGDVPSAGWSGDEFKVHWYYLDSADDDLRSRSVVS
jgi:hypothetical protein